MPKPRTLVAAVLLPCAAATSQAPYQGNNGHAYFGHSIARIGGTFDALLGSPAAPSGIAVLGFSDSLVPTVIPGVGTVGLDLLAPSFSSILFALDPTGAAVFTASVPNTPALVQLPPLFAVVGVFEPGLLAVSKTTRIAFENAQSASPGGTMTLARAGHTATALGEGPFDREIRVLVAGGGGGTILVPQASTTTEVYSPLLRAFAPGPAMAVARALHAAVRLPNGRVLICGGTDSGGVCTATAEIYDPVTNSLSPTAPMRVPRAGHAATLLPNGRVLVTGGLQNYQNPLTNLVTVLNTAQDTGEVYDPIAGTWLAVPGTMNSKRSGHTQTLLPNGTVMICGGIRGGVTGSLGFSVPVFTAFCSVYDPVANTFTPGPPLLEGRAFHGASLLGSGDLLITGGSISNTLFGIVGATDSCEFFNGVSFQSTAALPQPTTNHSQILADNGSALIVGGLVGTFPTLVGTAVVGTHDGVSFQAAQPLGLNPGVPGSQAVARGAMVAVRVFDRSIALLGGTDGAAPQAESLVLRFP